MFYETESVVLSGIEFPYRIDNYVLAVIQSKFENITNFMMKIMGWGDGEDGKMKVVSEPSVEAVNVIFPYMVQEGFACRNEECEFDSAEIIRAIDKKPIEMALIIKDELDRCLLGKKKEMKKAPRKRMPKNE